MAAEGLRGFKWFHLFVINGRGIARMARGSFGGAADVPGVPTIRPTLLSVFNSETQNGQLAPFDACLLWQYWT